MNMKNDVLRDRRNLAVRFCLRNSAYAYLVRLADNETLLLVRITVIL